MTTPAPPQQPVQQPTQQQEEALESAALALAIAALLAGGTGVAAGGGVAAMIAVLKLRFALTSAAWSALGSVLSMVTGHPPAVTGVIGHASEQVGRMNAARRAQYVIAATRRVLGAARDARSQGQPVTAAIQAQLAKERRYFQMHQQAMWDRAKAAGQIDLEAAVHGDLLGWYAWHNDGRTTPECKSADRHNFYVSRPPDIGLPGIGPHAGCRCDAGPPWPGGKLLAGSGPGFARAA